MATCHNPGVLQGDATWVVDIDLAVLGQSDAVYRQFERNVRKEYFFVQKRTVAGRSAVRGLSGQAAHLSQRVVFLPL